MKVVKDSAINRQIYAMSKKQRWTDRQTNKRTVHSHPYQDLQIYRVGQKTGLFLEVCNFCVCWDRITFYIPNCSVFYLETGVLYVTVFKHSLRNFSVRTQRSNTNFSDDVHFLHVFHLIFTINANFVYIPVEATCSTSIICPNHYSQYFNENGISLSFCVLTLIPAEQFYRMHFR